MAVTGASRFAFGSPLHFEPFEKRIALSEERGVDTEVLSLLPPLFRYDRPAPEGLAAAREHNDELSELTVRYPGRFLGLATVPLQNAEFAAEEARRALSLAGIVGVTIGTHVAGVNLDARELEPFFTVLDELSSFVLIHPIAPRDGMGALDQHYLRNVIGNPLETTIAAASLMASGRLEQYPQVNYCLAHGGGYTCAAMGRLAHASRVRHEFTDRALEVRADLHRRFYYDTLVHDELTLRHLIDVVGSDHVLLGTDFPADMGQVDAAGFVRGSHMLNMEEKASILSGNIRHILGEMR